MIQAKVPSLPGYLFICPWCGDCWARLEGTDSNVFFHHRYVPCAHHRDDAYGSLPGILTEGGKELLDLLPPDLVERDFHLILGAISE